MSDLLGDGLSFQAKALVLRSERQRQLAGNIANADTPGYQARDFDFAAALSEASGTGSGSTRGLAVSTSAQGSAGMTDPRHMPIGGGAGANGFSASTLAQAKGYATAAQPSADNNTVDLDRERAAFANNAIRYEATLRFINGQSKTLMTAITGQ